MARTINVGDKEFEADIRGGEAFYIKDGAEVSINIIDVDHMQWLAGVSNDLSQVELDECENAVMNAIRKKERVVKFDINDSEENDMSDDKDDNKQVVGEVAANTGLDIPEIDILPSWSKWHAAKMEAYNQWKEGRLEVKTVNAAIVQESKLKASIDAMMGITQPDEIKLGAAGDYEVYIPGIGMEYGVLAGVDNDDANAVKAAVIADLYEKYKKNNAIPAIDLFSDTQSAQDLKNEMDKLSAAITSVNKDAMLSGEGPAEQLLDFFSKLKGGTQNHAEEMSRIISPEFRDSILNRDVIIPGKLGSEQETVTVKMKDVPKVLKHRIQGLKNEMTGLEALSGGLTPTDETQAKITELQKQLDVLEPMQKNIETIVKVTQDPRITSAKWLDRSMVAMKGLSTTGKGLVAATGLAAVGGLGYGLYLGGVAAAPGISAASMAAGTGLMISAAAVPIIGWAAVGVAALAVVAYGVYQTYKNWDKISAYMSDKRNNISEGAAKLWSNLGEVAKATGQYLRAVGNSIVRSTQQVMLDAGLYKAGTKDTFKDEQHKEAFKAIEDAVLSGIVAVRVANNDPKTKYEDVLFNVAPERSENAFADTTYLAMRNADRLENPIKEYKDKHPTPYRKDVNGEIMVEAQHEKAQRDDVMEHLAFLNGAMHKLDRVVIDHHASMSVKAFQNINALREDLKGEIKAVKSLANTLAQRAGLTYLEEAATKFAVGALPKEKVQANLGYASKKLDKLQARVAEAEKDVKDETGNKLKTSLRFAASNDRIVKLQAQLKNTPDDVELKEKLQKEQEKNSSLKIDFSTAKQDLEQAKDSLSKLNKEMGNAINEVSKLEKELEAPTRSERFEATTAAAGKKMTAARQALLGLNLEEAQERVEQLEVDIMLNDEAIAQLTEDTPRLKEELQQKNEQVIRLEEEVKQAIDGDGDLDALAAVLKVAEAEADALHNSIEKLSEISEKGEVLTGQLEAAQAVVAKLEAQAEAPTMRQQAAAAVSSAVRLGHRDRTAPSFEAGDDEQHNPLLGDHDEDETADQDAAAEPAAAAASPVSSQGFFSQMKQGLGSLIHRNSPTGVSGQVAPDVDNPLIPAGMKETLAAGRSEQPTLEEQIAEQEEVVKQAKAVVDAPRDGVNMEEAKEQLAKVTEELEALQQEKNQQDANPTV